MPRRSILIGTVADNEDAVSLTSFGAVGDGVTDDTAAFTAALAALGSDGGAIDMPPGNYKVTETLDLTTKTNVWLRGQGPRNTRITSTVTTAAGINAANNSTRFTRLSNFALYQSSLALPSTQRANNYGIRNTSGVGYQMVLDEVEVNYFGNSAIFIEGTTGPTVVMDCSLQSNSGYGVEVRTLSADNPQNVSIVRGNIQEGWGGILLNSANGFHVEGTDIELAAPHFPALYLQGACYGGALTNVTASIAAAPSDAPDGCVVFEDGPSGIVWTGGLNFVNISGGGAVDNFLLTGAGTSRNTFIGGGFVQSGSGVTTGYYANISGPVYSAFINPLLTATYQSGKNKVNDVAANFTLAFGVSAAGTILTPIGAPLATTTSGLATGSFWNDGGTVKVV